MDYEIQQILKNEQLDSKIFNATDILIYVAGGGDTPLQIFNKITDEIRQHIKLEVQVKLGLGFRKWRYDTCLHNGKQKYKKTCSVKSYLYGEK